MSQTIMSSSSRRGVFVGRANELGALEQALAQAAAARPALALIRGEAGVGKTRLVSELSDRARSRGALVLKGGCIDLPEGTLPYAPAVEGLRSLVRVEGPERVLALGGPEIGRLLPAELGPLSRVPDVDAGAQGRLFAAFARVLEGLGRAAPVVLIFEDLHWADRGTCDLLSFFARRLREARVLILVTYRADEPLVQTNVEALVGELGRLEGTHRVELARFDRGEFEQLVQAVIGSLPPQELVSAIFERSGGNAFFAEELIASGGDLPEGLRALLLSKLGALSSSARHTLDMLAVAGGRAHHRLVAVASPLSEENLIAALREAIEHHVIAHDADRSGYAFRHALAREALLSALPAGERRLLHRLIAQALEAEPELGDAAERALHWRAAGDAPHALAASFAAGRTADALVAFGDAADHYGRALELWPAVSDAVKRVGVSHVRLLELAAEASLMASRRQAAEVLFAELAVELDAKAEPVGVALVHTRRSLCLWHLGRESEAYAASSEAFRLTQGQPASEGTARVAAHHALRLTLSDRYPEAITAAREAIALAREAGTSAVEAAIRTDLGGSLVAIGQVEDGIRELRLALRLAREHRCPADTARVYVYLSDALGLAGELKEAVSTALEGAQIAELAGLGAGLGAASQANAAEFLVALGRLDEARDVAESVIADSPSGVPLVLCHGHAAAVSILQGDYERAAAHLASARSQAGDVAMLSTAITRLDAELALGRGQPEAAIRHLDGAKLVWETDLARSAAVELRALADIAVRARAQRATQVAEEAVGRCAARLAGLTRARVMAEPQPPLPEVELFRALSVAELSRAQAVTDPAVWLNAAEVGDRLGRAFSAAYARRQTAEVFLSAGDRRSAVAPLQAAYVAATRMAARPLLRELEVLARRSRIEPAACAGESEAALGPAAGLGLTPRELDVLRELAVGRSNSEIGAHLFISVKTASLHVSHILAKLGVANRVQAALAAEHLGLIDDPDGQPRR
ncbi:MAG: helix-turn-helix transcriptional regulator [Solirubrobacteraceae bacterium]